MMVSRLSFRESLRGIGLIYSFPLVFACISQNPGHAAYLAGMILAAGFGFMTVMAVRPSDRQIGYRIALCWFLLPGLLLIVLGGYLIYSGICPYPSRW